MLYIVEPHKQVVSIFAAAFLYGLYTSTLLVCLRWLLFLEGGWKRRGSIQWPMVAVTTAIFILTAIHLALSLAGTTAEVYTASYLLRNSPRPVPLWYSIVQRTLENVTAMLVDSVLMYRCWVEYKKTTWIILFPIIPWIGGLICIILQMYLQPIPSPDQLITTLSWKSTAAGLGIVLTPFWGSVATLNLYCTTMLISRFSRTAVESGRGTLVGQLNSAAHVLAASGFLYLSTTLTYFVVWIAKNSDIITIVSTSIVPLFGITFNLILIHTREKVTYEERNLDLTDSSTASFSLGQTSKLTSYTPTQTITTLRSFVATPKPDGVHFTG